MAEKEVAAKWERARKPDQIEARRKEILSSAAKLLDEGGVESTGLSAIARAAGLSKANLYRYFESREAILMTIFLEELTDWVSAMTKMLDVIEPRGDVAAVAQAFADSLEGRERYCDLMSALASVLERNLTVETIAQQKTDLRNSYISLIPPLRRALPQFSNAQANEFLIMQALFQMGLWPHTNPSPEVNEVLDREEFADLRMHFGERVRWHALLLLRGLETVESPRIRPE